MTQQINNVILIICDSNNKNIIMCDVLFDEKINNTY